MHSFDQDVGAIIARLERHARAADQTAVATELLRASAFREETERKQYEELKIRCGQWLKPSNVEHVHLNQVSAKLDGTCDWIASNNVYRRWVEPGCLTAHDRLLIISGTHGCGKSVLASSIAVKLEKDDQHTLFFAFSSSDGSRQTFENLIRTLLWHLLHKTKDKKGVDIIHHLRLDGEPSVSALWEAFIRVISAFAKPVYCVVDGVDECIDFDRIMSMKIMQVLETCPNLHILLLGRPHVIQAYSDTLNFQGIDVTPAMLNHDIEVFINHEIDKSAILSLPEFRETTFETLKDKSDGMFLWVRLMVDELMRSLSKSDFEERLRALPRGLEEAYELVFLRLSQRLDDFELRLARNVLALMTVSCRPLCFDELRYVHALREKSLETSKQPLEEYLLLQPSQRVMDILGGVVSATEGVFHFIHSSVRDFLVRPEDQWACKCGSDRAVLNFRVDIIPTHRSFSWLCLDYMRLEKEKQEDVEPDQSQFMSTLCDRYPFLQYATLYTFFHLNRCGPLCSTTLVKISNVFESRQSVLWVEYFTRFLLQDITLELQVNEFLALKKRMAGTGHNLRLSAMFRSRLEETITQMRQSGKHGDLRAEQWEMFLDLTKDGETLEFVNFSSNQSNKSQDSFAEPDSANLRFGALSASSKDPTTAVSRVMSLLRSKNSLSVTHQIEILLRLHSSLSKTRVLVDPLKVLFQLLLKKASGISIFVLIAIGEFYEKLEKYKEALQVYVIASKRIVHLETPLKYDIQEWMGNCYSELSLYIQALVYYQNAFSGRKKVLGNWHSDTIKSLDRVFWTARKSGQLSNIEMLRLCDEICEGHDFIPDLVADDNLIIQSIRGSCYRRLGDRCKAAYMNKCLQATLKLHQKSPEHNCYRAYYLCEGGRTHAYLNDHDTALDFFNLALNSYNKSGHLISAIIVQQEIAESYIHLGQYSEAKELLEITLIELQRTSHTEKNEDVEWTKTLLDRILANENSSGEFSSQSSRQLCTVSLHSFAKKDDENTRIRSLQRRNSADF